MRAPKGETVARALQRCDRINDAYARGLATVRDIRESERLLSVAIVRECRADDERECRDTKHRSRDHEGIES